MRREEDPSDRKKTGTGIGYVVDKQLFTECSRLDKFRNRSIMLHTLLRHTGVLQKLQLLKLKPAPLEDLLVFHSEAYVDFLRNPSPHNEEEFGFGYDCPVLDKLADHVRTIAAGSQTAAEILLEERVQVAVNWSGGWHHAKRDRADGFCYVNDIVLAIHKLQSRYKKIMYIDLDVHHGDGVEDAFSSTDKVLTLSIHKMEPGFFPGTGSISDCGFGRGKNYSVNIPLRAGATDTTFIKVFQAIFPTAVKMFRPEVFVLQVGADGLTGDPLGGLNLTPLGLSTCVQQVVALGLPVLLLGGGGYNIPNTVRCWTKIMADLVDVPLCDDVPDEDPFFLSYGPDFTLSISPGTLTDANSGEYVEFVIAQTTASVMKIGTS